MSSQNNLEIKGHLRTNPLADLLAEISEANLTGSLRLAHEAQKAVVYLNGGKPVFVASNERRHRLYETLLRDNRIGKSQLAEIPNFTNDLELAESLKKQSLFSKEEMDAIFSEQITEITKAALDWNEGEWIFSPLMRIKETVQFEIKLQELLMEHARKLPAHAIGKRMKSAQETFGAKPSAPLHLNLLPQEAFVFSRFEKSFLKVEELSSVSGLPEASTLQILYTLWLGGFLFRQNWNPAFSERKISEISSAKLALKKEEEIVPSVQVPVVTPIPAAVQPVDIQPKAEIPAEITLEEYLNRAENSDSYYEFFGVAESAASSEIKRTYFALAKLFHPDKFHQEKDVVLLQRIQDAFTQAAQAYETLKNDETRKTYDYKLSKRPATKKTKEPSGASIETIKSQQAENARKSFEEGFALLTADEYDEALPLLARAVQFAPDNARYHAFYGKALSSDERQRYKASAEMETAVRLEPDNPTFRIILAEFFIQYELFRRAEGELQRLLTLNPDHHEARALLDSLPGK